MTQIGEGIAVPIARLEEGKCILCGKTEHDNKKKDEIKPSGWKRKSKFKGVGGNFVGKKKRFIRRMNLHQTALTDHRGITAWHLAHLLLMQIKIRTTVLHL